MPHYIQQTPTGPVNIAECACCAKDLRLPKFDELKLAWDGICGCFNGKWEFICRLCVVEAETGRHEGGWRW